MLKVNGVLETALYVENLQLSTRFYQSIFNLEILNADDRFCAFNVADRQVLLLFRNAASANPRTTPGGIIPPHDGTGQLHMAFSIPAISLEAWEKWLDESGVLIESKVAWSQGGTSLYFRDPDKHLIELATPGLWSIY